MAEYIEREALLELVEHLDKNERCKNCYHLSSCDAWVRNATTLYDDYIYSVENCPYYISTADVVEVVRCKDCENWDNSIRFLTACACSYWSSSRLQPRYRQPDDFCSCGERKEVVNNG